MSTKSTVLSVLEENVGSAVSGEVLARQCGVSRTAIWKAVNSLRQSGCAISGSRNGGYILQSVPDILNSERIFDYIAKHHPQFSDITIECHAELDSTITYAQRELARCGALRNADGELTAAGRRYHRALIVAEKQTAGRGRMGKTFVSPQKTGIYLSVLYAPRGGISRPARLTACAAVAVCRAIRKLYSAEPKIKWVNDVFVHGKKVCGILTEGVVSIESGVIESAIVGIGINIADNPASFTAELADIAGSVTGSAASDSAGRAALAAEVACQCLALFDGDTTYTMQEYKDLSFILGHRIEVCPVAGSANSAYEATAMDITDDASLVVQLPDGTRRTLLSGEVSLRSAQFAAL